MPKVPEVVIPTFSEKEIVKLLSQPNTKTNEGFRDYCILLTFIDTGIRLSELTNLPRRVLGIRRYLWLKSHFDQSINQLVAYRWHYRWLHCCRATWLLL